MKKTFYLCLLALSVMLLHSSRSSAQYTITSHSEYNPPDSACFSPGLQATTSGYVAGMTMQVYYGDGTNSIYTVSASGSGGYVSMYHAYSFPGVYTVKEVLISGGVRMDSVTFNFTYPYCATLNFNFYYDANNNCVFDSTIDSYVFVPITVEVDSAGHPIDTITAAGSFFYPMSGPVGTIFKFTVISLSPGLTVSCPSPASLTDTIGMTVNAYVTKKFAIQCSSSTGLDLGVYPSNRCGRHRFQADILVNNAYCTATSGTLTMTFSPKYSFVEAIPAPTSISGNVLTWNLTGITAITPKSIYVHCEAPTTALLTAGDTVHTSYVLTPISGDSDPTNNTRNCVDTVRSSYDPNLKTVVPSGLIHAGTNLQYTINFENTGNDTAFNIHVMDTLSANVDVRSFKVVTTSANMSSTIENIGGVNIIKFDFPNINLLDSSHHGKCDGLVVYTINAKAGLANGTVINNRAGIYFDDNDVVMTNTTTNIIGIPTSVSVMTNSSKFDVYPNPVSDELNIKADNAAYSTITITNITGQVMYTQEYNAAGNEVNVKALPSGIYIVTLRGAGGVKVQKFEKR